MNALKEWKNYVANDGDIAGEVGQLADMLATELSSVSAEVSNLKLANEEARKTIDRLNMMIPRDACDSGGEALDENG